MVGTIESTPGSAAVSLSQSGTPEPRLHQAAVQFEAMLLKDLIKPLSQTDGLGSGDEAQQNGALQSFAVDAVAGTLAKSGALGFAKQIEASLAREAQKHYSLEGLKS